MTRVRLPSLCMDAICVFATVGARADTQLTLAQRLAILRFAEDVRGSDAAALRQRTLLSLVNVVMDL